MDSSGTIVSKLGTSRSLLIKNISLNLSRCGNRLKVYQGSWDSRMGEGWLLDRGRYPIKSLNWSRASTSFSKALWATPEMVVWVLAPPSSSNVTSSFVTDYFAYKRRNLEEMLVTKLLELTNLDNFWTSDEKVRCILHHKCEISEGRWVYGTSSARPHN